MNSENTSVRRPRWRELAQRMGVLAFTILIVGVVVAIPVFIFIIEADVPGSEV